MLDLVSSGLLSLWLDQAEVISLNLPLNPRAIESSVLQLTATGDNQDANDVLQKYLQDIRDRGFNPESQGIWLQSDYQILSQKEGFKLHSSASLTKVATSLVSLKNWGPQYQFQTLIGSTGIIQNGVLTGDLVIEGGNDPLFVWETAVGLGNALNGLGVGQVTGDLVIVGDFAMNFQRDPLQAGNLLKQALDPTQWPPEAAHYFQQMPLGTRKPQIRIAGNVRLADLAPSNQRILLRYSSLPLVQLLKQMNIYSNNDMAEMFGKALGGGNVVAERAAWYSGVSNHEIHLINSSGLGQENQITPRAVSALFRTLQNELSHWPSPGNPGNSGAVTNYTIADVFPVAGLDQGTVKERNIPATAVVKTGTLSDVSALGGVLPTRDHGLLWFTVMNRGDGVEELRHQQDNLLQAMTQKWGLPLSPPAAVAPTLYNAAPKSGQDLADHP